MNIKNKINMSDSSSKNKDETIKKKKYIFMSKMPKLTQNEESKKNKITKIKTYNNRRTLFIKKNKLLIEEIESNQDNELTIKSNNFTSMKKEYIIHSLNALRNNIETKSINSKINKNELCYKNVFDFKPETERNLDMDRLMQGFMRKKDYDLNNLINKKNKKNKKERAKTGILNKNRVDKSINALENNINDYRNFFYEKKTNNNNYNNFDINSNLNNYKTLSNGISNLNEDEIIKKKKNNYENIINIFTDINRKVIFIDNKNNLVSKRNTINLLNEEQYLIFKKLKKDYNIKNFSEFIKNKEGKKIILPILFKNIIKRNNNKINIIEKETNNNLPFKFEKDKNNINKIYYILDLKPSSSRHETNNINRNYFIENYDNNKNKNDIFITNYSSKNKLNLNQENFNNVIFINKRDNNNNYDQFNRRNNSTIYKNLYFNFNSKYPYTDTNGFEIIDKIEKENKPITDRKKENAKILFKKKLKKNFIKNTGNINMNKTKKFKIAKTDQNINENFIKDFSDNNLVIKKNIKKENKKNKEYKENKDKKESKLNILVKKDNKEIKSKENSDVKIRVARSYLNKNKNYKNNFKKYKNRDLLKIKNTYNVTTEDKKNNFMEESPESPTNIQKNNVNSILNLDDFYEKYFFEDNEKLNILKEDSENEEIDNVDKKNTNPKRIDLLITHIKKVLDNEKRKEEKKLKDKKDAELKKSNEFFIEQIEKFDRSNVSKFKRLFSEMYSSNKEDSSNKKNFSHSFSKNYHKVENSLINKSNINEMESIKDEDEEEKNIKSIKNEKNKLLIEQMNLINEIKFYMSTMDDPENQKKFENLIKQIESYKQLDDLEYIKSIKENFGNFKDEIEDIFRTKEAEDRINGFVTNLDKEINKTEVKRSFYESLLNIMDYKFKTIFSKPETK